MGAIVEEQSKKKKKKKDRKREKSRESPEAEVSPKKSKVEAETEPEVSKSEKKKKKKKSKSKDEEKPDEAEKEPEAISTEDVTNIAFDVQKQEQEKEYGKPGGKMGEFMGLGQYTGATLEGGSARLDKFARLLGGKKKESKGLFGRKPVPAPNQQQAGNSNVVNGNDLNRKLEDQFYRAKGYHNQN